MERCSIDECWPWRAAMDGKGYGAGGSLEPLVDDRRLPRVPRGWYLGRRVVRLPGGRVTPKLVDVFLRDGDGVDIVAHDNVAPPAPATEPSREHYMCFCDECIPPADALTYREGR